MKVISVNDIAHGRVAKVQHVDTRRLESLADAAVSLARKQTPKVKVLHTAASVLRVLHEQQNPFLLLVPLSFGVNLYLAVLRSAPNHPIIVERM